MEIRYDRLILSMTDSELEQFCRAWVEKKSGYFEVKRYAGSGDLGRDVVGFLTNTRHDGQWDNYQCKQYRTPAGPLAKYAHIPVKQGMCHHFVNDGEMSWKIKKP